MGHSVKISPTKEIQEYEKGTGKQKEHAGLFWTMVLKGKYQPFQLIFQKNQIQDKQDQLVIAF